MALVDKTLLTEAMIDLRTGLFSFRTETTVVWGKFTEEQAGKLLDHVQVMLMSGVEKLDIMKLK